MTNNYSSRDYFDTKFNEIDRRFSILENKLDKIHGSIYGNGNIGLIDRVRQNEIKLKIFFYLVIFLIPLQVKESRDIIIGIIKTIIGA